MLLEYYLHEHGGTLFVLQDGSLSVVPLAVPAAEVRRLLYLYHLNMDAAARDVGQGRSLAGLEHNARGILHRLYAALIEPAGAYLAGCERLVVVPYGPLHAIPFHALHDGTRYLVERLEVSTCPSSTLLRLCDARPPRAGRSALVVAHSGGGALPSVLAEARAVADLLPGELRLEEQATRTAVIEGAPRHGVLHLAAHGHARLDNPAFAHVSLADGQLSTIDIFNLPLDGALVALSACETGRSAVVGGDELVGLSRGFLYAGASTLVQSLWRVEDGSTAHLMERFYRALCQGAPSGTALRQAQLAILADRGAHPFVWAPFQLVGHSGRLQA